MTGHAADEAPWRLIGTPRFGGILVVADHAGWAVPGDIDLGIAPELFGEHIAQDIGTMAVAQLLAARPGIAAFVGRYSRLVCDLNRDEDAPCIVPAHSDGRDIPGNILDEAGRAARLARVHRPYHARLGQLLEEVPFAGVNLMGVQWAARLAIPLLVAEGLPGKPLAVGDQQPYSGRDLNYTMNRHAEADGRPYLGVEIRQDQIGDAVGQAVWAERLALLCNRLALELG